MGLKMFDTANYANKAAPVGADLLALGDSEATTGGVPDSKTITLSQVLEYVEAEITFALASTGQVTWSSGADPEAGIDTGIGRGGAGVISITNGSSTVYGTLGYTGANNIVRLQGVGNLQYSVQSTNAHVFYNQNAATSSLALIGEIDGADLDGVMVPSDGAFGWSSNTVVTAGNADTVLYRSAATVLNLTTGDSTDAGTRLRVGIAGTAYTNAADTAGVDVYFTAQSGGAHSAADPAGGSLVFTPGAAGAGGAGAAGKVIVRQPGGTPGTDEITFLHDGGNAVINNADGGIAWQFGGTTYQYWTTAGIRLRPDEEYTFTTSNDLTSRDTGILRVTAGVVAPSNGQGSAGWLQNTAGSSRVTTSNVTNVTTTPAAITGLSFPAIAGRKYAGRIKIWCLEATAADGFIFDLDGGTATFSSFRATYRIYDTLSATAALTSANVTAIATDFTGATLTGEAYVEIDFAGVCTATTGAGTFIPRFAKASDAAGAAFTVYVDSFMLVEDVP